MGNHSVTLGKSGTYGNSECFLSQSDRARHIYTIGRTGSGKTTFLRSLALQDIHMGRGVCVIDPHGDNAQALADSIPKYRLNDTIYFDAGERDNVIGFNLLSGIKNSDEAELVASEIITMFKGLFRDSWGEWLEYLFKNTLLAITELKNEPISLVCVQRMLEDSQYRNSVLKRVQNPVVLTFWEHYFSGLSKRAQLDRISSTLNKVGKYSMSPVLRNIVCQWKSGFDMQRVMDNNQILIVNLSKGRIGADNANFIGAALMSKIVSSALRRSNIKEKDRVDFNLHIDEFQNITSDEFTTIVSEARKYALYLHIAHQNFDQISEKVLNQITKDAGTIVAFKVAFEDNEKLSKAFSPVTPDALASTQDGSFWVRTGAQSPVLVNGYSPAKLDKMRTGSFSRVVKNTLWRYSRPRSTVELEFNSWYRSSVRGVS